MYAFRLIVLFALAFAAICSAANDRVQRMREAEEIAARDLDKWEAAVATHDCKAEADLLNVQL